MNIRLNCEKASDSSKNPKSPTLRAFSTPSATSFFFKANPKQILNTVKKVLSPSDIENENDSSEVTELKKGATGPEEEELLTLDRPYSSSDSPLAHEAIEITSDEDLRLDAGRKRPVVIDLSDEGEEDYSRKIPCARAARKKAFVSTEETLNAVGKRVATTGGKITIVKAPSSQEDIMPVVSTTSHLSSPEIDPLLLKYASPSKAAPPLTPAIALPLKRYKMTIHDDFPYHFGDRTKHVITRTLTSVLLTFNYLLILFIE